MRRGGTPFNRFATLLWLVVAGFSFAAFLRECEVTSVPLSIVVWAAWLLGLACLLVTAEDA